MSSAILTAPRGAHLRPMTPARRVRRWLERLAAAVIATAIVVLAAVVAGPRFLPYQALIVRSGSMTPTLPIGSVVFYHREAASAVKKGQIILFAEPGTETRITHRVYRILQTPSGEFFQTKGDANALPDPWRVRAAGTGWVESFDIPYLGYPFAVLSSPLARIILVSVPAILLAVILVLEQGTLRRERERADPQ